MELEAQLPAGSMVDPTETPPQDPWWDGRQLAIRPDVPSNEFDPEGLVLVKSDHERLAVQKRISEYVQDPQSAEWPAWLSDPSPADDELLLKFRNPLA